MQDGPASQSYGLQVAQLAGVPQPVIRAARKHLAALEAQAAQSSGQFDLFAAPPEPEAPETPGEVPAALQELEAIDPDSLSPREALDALYRLKRLSKQE